MNLLPIAVVDQFIEEYEAHIEAMRPKRGSAPPLGSNQKMGTSALERYIARAMDWGGSDTGNNPGRAVEAVRAVAELSSQACRHHQLRLGGRRSYPRRTFIECSSMRRRPMVW